MKRKKRKYAKCPSCDTEKHKTEMELAISEMKKQDRKKYKNYKELGIDTYLSFLDSDFNWACDACLESKKAIIGNPVLQNYCWHPHYAYFDFSIICKTCKNEFIFSKEEKKYWYESLKFWIDSEPSNCITCRKDIRLYKSENKILSEILRKREEDIDSNDLQKVIEIYSKWQMEEKAKYYQSIMEKRKRFKST